MAVNPFKKVSLYGNDYIEAYKRKSMDNPHVYAITDTAMREMIRGNLIPVTAREEFAESNLTQPFALPSLQMK